MLGKIYQLAAKLWTITNYEVYVIVFCGIKERTTYTTTQYKMLVQYSIMFVQCKQICETTKNSKEFIYMTYFFVLFTDKTTQDP